MTFLCGAPRVAAPHLQGLPKRSRTGAQVGAFRRRLECRPRPCAVGPVCLKVRLASGGARPLSHGRSIQGFIHPHMSASVSVQYAARVAAGKIERDDAQEAIVAQAGAAREAARRASSRAQIVLARLAVRRAGARGRADQGPLHFRRRRPRQDHADGPVLRGLAGRAQAPRPFP